MLRILRIVRFGRQETVMLKANVCWVETDIHNILQSFSATLSRSRDLFKLFDGVVNK